MYLGTTLNVLSSLPLSRCRLVRLILPHVNEMVCFLHIRQLIWPSHFHKIHGPAHFPFSLYIIYPVNCTSPACYPDISYSVALVFPVLCTRTMNVLDETISVSQSPQTLSHRKGSPRDFRAPETVCST